MDLYFHPMSGCSRRVLALLGHLDVSFTPHIVDLAAGAQTKPDYLALNPNGKVPTLVDGDDTLYESAAILRRLAREHRPSLLGEGSEQDTVNQWMSWTGCHLSPALSNLNAQTGLRAMRGMAPDPEAAAAAHATLAPLLQRLDTHLAEQPWLAGDRATLPDFYAVPAIEASQLLAQLDCSGYPAVARWLTAASELEGWPVALARPE